MLKSLGVAYEERGTNIPLNSRRCRHCVKVRGWYLAFERIKIHTDTQSETTFR